MSKPVLLLLGEPTTGPAPTYAMRIKGVHEDSEKQGKTMLLVEQNAPFAATLSDYFYVLRSGKVIAEGKRVLCPKM